MATKKEWDSAKMDYVSGVETKAKLMKRLGVTKKAMEDRMAREGWEESRIAYWRDVTNTALGERRQQDISKLANLAASADKFEDVIQEFLATNRFWNSQDMINIAKAMESAAAVRRDLYDIPKASELHAQDIAERRLKLEESKADAAVNPPVVRIIMDNAGTDDLNG